MLHEHYRYFIELRPTMDETTSRLRAQEERQRRALDFIHNLREFLDENSLTEKVQTLDITIFGQVHITCESDIIDLVRSQDSMDIAAIRQASAFHNEGLKRLRDNAKGDLRRSA